MTFDIPILIVVDNVPQQTTIRVRFELGLRTEEINLEFIYDGQLFKSTGKSNGFIEDELYDIFSQLPKNAYLKICLSCAFSRFNPAGNGAFGCLACFRNNKDGIRGVKHKSDLFRVWDTMTEFVQETHLCSEFEKWQKNS